MRAWLAIALALALPAAARADEELAVIVHPQGAARRLDPAQLEAIFTSVFRTWPDGARVVAFNYPPQDPLRDRFDRAVLRLEPEEVGRFWIDQRVRGGAPPPRQVSDPALLLRLVGRLPGAIGYLPSRLVDKTVRVVARVRDGKVVPP